MSKDQIKEKLMAHLHYISIDSPFKTYHNDRYNELILQFNRILAKEIK